MAENAISRDLKKKINIQWFSVFNFFVASAFTQQCRQEYHIRIYNTPDLAGLGIKLTDDSTNIHDRFYLHGVYLVYITKEYTGHQYFLNQLRIRGGFMYTNLVGLAHH